MKSKDIKIGETYMFVATDNPARKHLEGKHFFVSDRKTVYRRLKKGTRKVYRFENEYGDQARAEELEPIDEMNPDQDSKATKEILDKWRETETGAEGPTVITPEYVHITPKEDSREWPCSECETGEMKQEGCTSPNGTTTYTCTNCGHSERYP